MPYLHRLANGANIWAAGVSDGVFVLRHRLELRPQNRKFFGDFAKGRPGVAVNGVHAGQANGR